MKKKVVITHKCPVCGYVHEVVKHGEKRELTKVETVATDNGVQTKVATRACSEVVYDKVYVTQGDTPFKYLKLSKCFCVSQTGEKVLGNYLGMFCPKCGVFLDINKCTQVTEE